MLSTRLLTEWDAVDDVVRLYGVVNSEPASPTLSLVYLMATHGHTSSGIMLYVMKLRSMERHFPCIKFSSDMAML